MYTRIHLIYSEALQLRMAEPWCEHIKSAALHSTSSAAAQETHGSRGTFLLFRSEGDDARALTHNKDIHSGTHSKLCPSTMHRAASEGMRSYEVLDVAWIVRCMHKQFHIIIAPYCYKSANPPLPWSGLHGRGLSYLIRFGLAHR